MEEIIKDIKQTKTYKRLFSDNATEPNTINFTRATCAIWILSTMNLSHAKLLMRIQLEILRELEKGGKAFECS